MLRWVMQRVAMDDATGLFAPLQAVTGGIGVVKSHGRRCARSVLRWMVQRVLQCNVLRWMAQCVALEDATGRCALQVVNGGIFVVKQVVHGGMGPFTGGGGVGGRG